jgi:hypothetical protein
MKYICPECGNEIPEGSDFCHVCGCLKSKSIKIDDNGKLIGSNGKCSVCGSEVGPSDLFCEHCGNPITKAQMRTFKPTVSRKGWAAIALALIPGLINVFGLGHLVYKMWSRAVMYLVMSAFIIYIQFFVSGISGNMKILLFLTEIVLYMFQALEVFALATGMPKPK